MRFAGRSWQGLLTAPGNDRRCAHLTRRFELLLHERLQESVDDDWLLRPGGIDSLLLYQDEVTRKGHPDSFDHTGRWASEKATRYRFTPASLIGDGVQGLAMVREGAGVVIEALDEGSYELTIEVAGPDGAAATAIRRFRVGEG
ncbi:MAG: hypothetical protein OXF01_15145 [Gemmatimonadetes bacterium]|nr:hypothetical protein [Gemmatimonadota bacterium]